MKTDPDAADLFGTLKTLLRAPTLLAAARNAFDAQRTMMSRPALDELVRLRIVQVAGWGADVTPGLGAGIAVRHGTAAAAGGAGKHL